MSDSQGLCEPRPAPRARGWIVVLGLVLVVAGVVVAHDALVVHGVMQGVVWLAPVLGWLAQPSWSAGFYGAAVLVGLCGVLMVASAVAPRPHTHFRVDEAESVWMRPVDVARACSARAERQMGVLTARTVVTRRQVVVTVTGDTSDESLQGRVLAAVGPVVELVPTSPQVRVRVVASRQDV